VARLVTTHAVVRGKLTEAVTHAFAAWRHCRNFHASTKSHWLIFVRRVTSWISEELRRSLRRSDSSGLIQRFAEVQNRFAMLFVFICLNREFCL